MAEIDERYKRGKIYTIRCRYDDSLIYVGSTIDTLAKRMGGHRTTPRNNHSTSLYNAVQGDWDNWYIELYEEYPCNNRQELERREGQVIREIGTINKFIAGRMPKERYTDNRDEKLENMKDYYKKNRDELLEKVKEYRQNNRDKLLEKEKEYRIKNRDEIAERMKEYRIKNRDELIAKKKEKIICNICGCNVRKDGLKRHQETKKCMNYNLDNN